MNLMMRMRQSTRKPFQIRGHLSENTSHNFTIFLCAIYLINSRTKQNLFVTFLAAPVLAILISTILRYSPPEQSYSFASNLNMKFHIYLDHCFIFLGLSNSLDEIFSEKRILIREKKITHQMQSFPPGKKSHTRNFCLVPGSDLFCSFQCYP